MPILPNAACSCFGMQTQFVDRVSCLVIAFQRIKDESHSTSRRPSQSLPALIQTQYINSSVTVSAEVFPCAEELERHQHLSSLVLGGATDSVHRQIVVGIPVWQPRNSIHRQSGAVLLSPPCRKLAFSEQQCCLETFRGLITQS